MLLKRARRRATFSQDGRPLDVERGASVLRLKLNNDPGGQTPTLTLAFQYKTQTLGEGAKMAAIAVGHVTPQRTVAGVQK